MKSSMIFWLVSVLILSIAIDCTKLMKPKQMHSVLIEKKEFEKGTNSTEEEVQIGKLSQAKERHHYHKGKGKRIESNPSLRSEEESPVTRQSPPARSERPNLRQSRNPPARNEYLHNPSLRSPAAPRVETCCLK